MHIQPSDLTHAIQQLATGVGQAVRTVAHAAASGLQSALSHRQSVASSDKRRNATVPLVSQMPVNPWLMQPHVLPPTPIRASLSFIGEAPGDGNCFFHSAIQVAGEELVDRLGLFSQSQLSPQLLRRHVAGHLIDLYKRYNDTEGRPEQRQRLLNEHPHLIALSLEERDSGLDLNHPDHQVAFVEAVGDANLQKCFGLTPSQLRHVFNVAGDRLWNFETCDVMPHLLASALPGLRLSVLTPTDTEMSVIGHGVDPVHLMVLDVVDDGSHYRPAWR